MGQTNLLKNSSKTRINMIERSGRKEDFLCGFGGENENLKKLIESVN